MIKKALLMDAKQFAKKKQIRAKRPSEYWLLFIKRHVLTYKDPWFRLYYLVFLIPILVIVISIITDFTSEDGFMVLTIFSFIIPFFAFTILKEFEKKPFVPLEAFQELAKFIISIKGDVHRNLIGLRINSSPIEADINTLDANKIGLKNIRGVKYKPYEIERFKANFTLKDGSVCLISMHQIVLRVSTTKRRSSGKTKTKMKRKHKFFYQLTLKLKASDYKMISPKALIHVSGKDTAFDVTVKEDGDFCWVKVKSKKKMNTIASKLNTASKHKDSIFTNMMQHLIENKVMVNRIVSKSIKH